MMIYCHNQWDIIDYSSMIFKNLYLHYAWWSGLNDQVIHFFEKITGNINKMNDSWIWNGPVE